MKLGPYALEQDYSSYVAHASSIIFAAVGTATKGPINTPTVCTSTRDFIEKFGPLNTNCLGLYAGQYFLEQASKLYFVRAAKDTATAATVSIPGFTSAATRATVSIAGVGEGELVLNTAIVLQALQLGTDYNGYDFTVSEGATAGSFNLTIKDANENLLESYTNLTIENFSENFESSYFEEVSIAAGATAITAGTYTSAEGSGDIVSALTFRAPTEGSYFNNFKIRIMEAGPEIDTFKVCILNSSNVNVQTCKVTSLASADYAPIAGYLTLSTSTNTAVRLKNGIYEISGGTDGIEGITSAEYITAGETLLSSNYDLNLLAVPGVSDAVVINRMLQIAESRGDCLYLVDPPNNLDETGVMNWHNGTGAYAHPKFNSSYGALYYSWQKIYDSVNKTYVTVPPSVPVCATFAFSARTTELWYPPAGLTRGLIRGVYEPITATDNATRDLLYSDDNSVNCIINDPQAGLCIFGQKTLSRANTALNRVNVRMLLNYLKRVVTAACQYLTFEPNDRVTWNNFEDLIEPTLKSIGQRRGLYDYRIVKGEALVTDSDIDNYRMPCQILIKPTKSAEEIPIYFTITTSGADFNDVLENQGIYE